MRKILIFTLILIGVISCGEKNKTDVDVSGVLIDLKVSRFEQDFYTATNESLLQVKKKYPLLFPREHDSVWINKIMNKDEQELFVESQKKYKDFASEAKQIERLFKYVKYYNKDFKAPKVVTMLTNMNDRIVYADTLLFISLDNFLGKEHSFYSDYPGYIKEKNTRNHIVVDVAKEIINKQVSFNSKRRFLDKIIYQGKKMYLLDAYLPNVKDELKIGYSPEKMKWVLNNEEQIWKYFIDKKLLYSTDLKLNQRFLDNAPFSKFYMEHDSQSPGKVGVYVGWQLVRSFMKNNDVSLQELMKMSVDEIFKKSKYKPRK